MNKLLWLLLPLLADAVDWRSWEQGKAEAHESGRNILAALVRDDCHYCHDMEQAVFNDAAMSRWVEGCFVPVKINLSKRGVPFEARVAMTPTFVILQPDGSIIKTVPGSWNREDFTALTASACTKE
ncbi:DUF255 domain-containing protein [Sulfurimonas sp. HSL-3221]|uniref:DUF255 domain-containing protein n=1 Tax=Thiomicrolovo sulfuroxydans TaxID=2894755 RepID=UPI001E399F31|nr:DUF255 domain-containing protein [Sulfurimonas sp. HSL-3221]UFS63275.1 DUF255 domain-containing protein [Sulfurimonas sp. HSL-3221]